ncbi:MAG: nicotinate-nucleotide adenylyltransferase [Chloroflexi bacterium]|nr:nicotinate-nucleotide adenylyltransferase [Chloroflexota bacterium]
MSEERALLTRLGVMGGTFDPIHLGHLVAASQALHAFRLDRVLFVPAARPWQKTSPTDPEDRMLMTMLAAATHPAFAVSRMEIDRRGPTYTLDTLTMLRRVMGEDTQLFFILGADALANLGTWDRVDGLAKVAEMIAVARPGYDLETIELDPSWPRVNVLDMPQLDISATAIRAAVRAGRPIDYLVPHDVADYIRTKGLYVGRGEGRRAS